MNMKTRDMCFVALMAALICIAAPIAVPVGPVPITLATLIVYLAGALLGWKKGVLAVLVYILIGAVGLPVFAGWEGGLSKIVGATGGYLIGYIPCALITGFGVQKWGERPAAYPIAMVIGTIVLYALGTAWFLIQLPSYTLASAMGVCVLPFLPGDAAKIVLASVLGIALRKRLSQLKVL